MNGLKKLSALTFFLFISIQPVSADPVEIPFDLYDHLVVVKGSIEGVRDLNLVIDSGATYTMISEGLAKKLRLKTDTVSVVSWGKKIRVRSGKLSRIQIGDTLFKDIVTRVGDLDISKDVSVDALIGLDLLRRNSVTIDYERKTLLFGTREAFSQQAVFYPNLPFLPIRMKIQGKPFVMVLDTGAPQLVFFDEKIDGAVEIIRTTERERIGHAGGRLTLRKILIEGAVLAEVNLETLTAYLMDTSSDPYGGASGIFSPASLNLKKLHLDFETNQISWEL